MNIVLAPNEGRNYCRNYDVFLSLNVVFKLANGADLDELQQPYAAFHLSLHYLSKHRSLKFGL